MENISSVIEYITNPSCITEQKNMVVTAETKNRVP